MKTTEIERTYMVLSTPKQALVSFEQKGNEVRDVCEFDGHKWVPDEEHGDLLQMAGRIGALRKTGIILDEEEVQIMMRDKKEQAKAEQKSRKKLRKHEVE